MSNRTRFTISSDFSLQQDTKLSPSQKDKKNLLLAKYINVGYYLVAPLLLGVFLGLAADNFFKTKPLFIIIFIIIGTVGVFYNLWKTTKNF